MKYLTKASFLATVGLIVILPILVAVHLVSAAGTATLSLTPSSGSLAPGDSLIVDVYEDSGTDNVNAVQANLTYSSNLLSFSSANSTGSAFEIAAQNTGGGGTIQIARGTTTPVNGRQFVSRLTFNATAGGTASVNFDSGSSVVVRSSDNLGESLTFNNGTYTISTPVSTGAITLSPATKTVTSGTNFDVQVYENSNNDGVNAVQANLGYDTSLLTFVGISNSSAWPLVAQNSASGGVVYIARGDCTGCAPITGTQLVATVTFKAANPGTADVGIAPGSGIILASNNTAMPAKNKGGTYTITSTSGSGSSGGGGSSSGSGTSKKSSTTSTPPTSYTSSAGPQTTPQTTSADSTGPTISDIKVTNLTTKSATITWKTSEPATSEVDYGLSTKLILTAGDVKLTQDHSVPLDPKQLIAHKTYHFVVKSADAAGNQSASGDTTFKTGSSGLNITKIGLISLGVVVLGALALAAATGFGAFRSGRHGSLESHGSYTEPKPLIVAGGPSQSQPVVQPQAPQTPQAPSAKKPTTTIIKGEDPQTPGEVIAPKNPPK